MTAIAACVGPDGRVWMASDSRASDSGIAVEQGEPKWCAWGSTIVGFAGDSEAEQVWRRVPWDRLRPDQWADAIRKVRRARDGATDPMLVIGRPTDHGPALWYYEGGCVYPSADAYAATGSGTLVVLGYLRATRRSTSPSSRVRGAIEAAIQHVPSCGGRTWVGSVGRCGG